MCLFFSVLRAQFITTKAAVGIDFYVKINLNYVILCEVCWVQVEMMDHFAFLYGCFVQEMHTMGDELKITFSKYYIP